MRAYKPKQISDDALEIILKAGMAAPIASAKYESMHIAVVQNEEILQEIMTATSDLVSKLLGQRKDMDFGAKTLIVVSGAAGAMPGIEYANAGCMIENMLLAATDMGIDNIIWGGAAAAIGQSEAMKRRLEIPQGFKPLLCASLGYAVAEESAKEHTIAVTRI